MLAKKSSQAKDTGSITLTTVVIGLLAAIGLFIGSVVVSYVMTTHQARSIADLASISTATVAARLLGDEPACEAGTKTAQQMQADVTVCEVVRAGGEVAVKIEVTLGLRWAIPGVVDQVSAVSYAGNPRLE